MTAILVAILLSPLAYLAVCETVKTVKMVDGE